MSPIARGWHEKLEPGVKLKNMYNRRPTPWNYETKNKKVTPQQWKESVHITKEHHVLFYLLWYVDKYLDEIKQHQQNFY